MPRNKSKKKNKNKSQKQNKQSKEATDQNSPSEDQPCVNNQQDDDVQAENLADVETIKLEDQQQVENPVIDIVVETVEDTKANEEESVLKAEEDEEVSNLKSVEEEPLENELSQPELLIKEESTPDQPSKKKRFSFFKRNKKSSSVLNVTIGNMDQKKKNKSDNGGATVQRAQSLSTFDREPKSRIPLHKFRSEKKKNSNLTASTSNVDSTSLVLNPGMDDWRMSGLLDNVRNKDSVPSLTLAPSNNPPSSSASQNQVKALNEETENGDNVSLSYFINDNTPGSDFTIPTGKNLIKKNAAFLASWLF